MTKIQQYFTGFHRYFPTLDAKKYLYFSSDRISIKLAKLGNLKDIEERYGLAARIFVQKFQHREIK